MEPLPEPGAVIVQVPSRAEYVHVLRAVTASVGSRLALPFDTIEDLRLAVDEASARLLAVHAGSSVLTLRIEPGQEDLRLHLSVDATVDDWPPAGLEDTLAWKVLVALVDSVRLEMDRTGPAIVLVRRLLQQPADA